MSKLEIKGKSILVTGANRGLGKAMVEQLIEKGATTVYAGSRNIENLAGLSHAFKDQVVPLQLDVTDQRSIDQAVGQIDTLDILINNAGTMAPGPLLSGESLSSLENNMAVNVLGPLRLANALHHHFEGDNATAIVNIISVAGFGNMPVLGTYSVSKAATHSITQGLRGQLSAHNTLVAGVYPGPMDTDMVDGWDMEKANPTTVAKHILEGVENGVEDIFPDAMSQQVGSLYFRAPKDVEQHFASMQ